MRARAGLLALALVVLAGLTPLAGDLRAAERRTLDVPGDYATIQEAIAASTPGDVILLAAGTYPGGVVVPDDHPGITIRGVDRNDVVFDGRGNLLNAIEVEADDVTLENMSAHDFGGNGFYWEGVNGYAGRYLTVWNVGLYGIYAIESRDGVFEHSYVSGAADAAFYIGECQPCDATLRGLTARLSAVGYSGTNASGNVVVEDSLFEQNATGIFPNSYDTAHVPPPQRQAIFRRNTVRDSGRVPTPRATPLGGFYGIGIGIAGGSENLVDQNTVTGSSRYGIAVFSTVDRAALWTASENRIVGNSISSSGTADLVLAEKSGAGNCFTENTAPTTDPPDLAGTCSSDGDGSARAAAVLVVPPPVAMEGLPEAPPYSDMPQPPAQPSMPGAGPVVSTAVPAATLVLAALAGAALVLLVVGVLGRTRPVVAGSRASRIANLLIVAGTGLLLAAGAGILLLGTASNGEQRPSAAPSTVPPEPQSSAEGSPTSAASNEPASTEPVSSGLEAYPGPPLTGVFDSCLPECDLYVVSSAGGEPRNLTGNGDEQHDGAPSISPNGQRLAFRCTPVPVESASASAAPEPARRGAICTVDIDGRGLTVLSSDPGWDFGAPSWSPEGMRIAVARSHVERGETEIVSIESLGPVIRPILPPQGLAANPAWSPSGDLIAHSCGEEEGQGSPPIMQVCVVDTTGSGQPRRLTELDGTCGAPAFAPTDAQLAVVCIAPGSPGGDLYLVSTSGGRAERLTDDGGIAPEGQARPVWSRDARFIFVRRDDGLWAFELGSKTWSFPTMPPLHGEFDVRAGP
jgi:Right handed beta helix region/WD40-like Beta Propeller Repeat